MHVPPGGYPQLPLRVNCSAYPQPSWSPVRLAHAAVWGGRGKSGKVDSLGPQGSKRNAWFSDSVGNNTYSGGFGITYFDRNLPGQVQRSALSGLQGNRFLAPRGTNPWCYTTCRHKTREGAMPFRSQPSSDLFTRFNRVLTARRTIWLLFK